MNLDSIREQEVAIAICSVLILFDSREGDSVKEVRESVIVAAIEATTCHIVEYKKGSGIMVSQFKIPVSTLHFETRGGESVDVAVKGVELCGQSLKGELLCSL